MEYRGLIRFNSIVNIARAKVVSSGIFKELQAQGIKYKKEGTSAGTFIKIYYYEGDDVSVYDYVGQDLIKDIKVSRLFNITRVSPVFNITESDLQSKRQRSRARFGSLLDYCSVASNEEAAREKIRKYFEII